MSTVVNKDLRLFLNEVNTGDGFSYSYNVYVYAENLEIIKVVGGLANEMFSEVKNMIYNKYICFLILK